MLGTQKGIRPPIFSRDTNGCVVLMYCTRLAGMLSDCRPSSSLSTPDNTHQSPRSKMSAVLKNSCSRSDLDTTGNEKYIEPIRHILVGLSGSFRSFTKPGSIRRQKQPHRPRSWKP